MKWEYEHWKSIRDAELYDTNRIVNPRYTRIIGFVYASCAAKGKARTARILLNLNIAAALYHFANGAFTEQWLRNTLARTSLNFKIREKKNCGSLNLALRWRWWDWTSKRSPGVHTCTGHR